MADFSATLPVDLLPLVARHLRDQGSHHTLSNLLRLNHETFPIASAILHSRLHFHSDDQLHAFLATFDPADPDGSISDTHQETLHRVRHVHLDMPPSSRCSTLILRLAELMPTYHLFPSCTSVSLHGNAVKALPTRGPSASYNNTKACLKVYDSIRRLCLPESLEIIRPKKGCTAYREMHTYFLTLRSDQRSLFTSLKDHWPDLASVDWGETHADQAYAVRGADNIYSVPECDCSMTAEYATDLFVSLLAGQGPRLMETPKALLQTRRVVLRGRLERIEKIKAALIERCEDSTFRLVYGVIDMEVLIEQVDSSVASRQLLVESARLGATTKLLLFSR